MIPEASKSKVTNLWFYAYPIIFGLAYSQEALFNSNQNTKFISGLALAGYRDVAADWMAYITDPFPLFSGLLKLQYQFLGLFVGVHLSFLLVAAAYGISGIWLAKNLFAHNEGKQRAILVFSLIWLFIHSVELRSDWLDFFPAGLAGQYILGLYYQPSGFGILLLTGTAAYVSGRSIVAAACFVLAPLFHPTYLIASALIAMTIIVLPANLSLGISWKQRMIFLSLVVFVLASYGIWSINLLSSGDPIIRSKAHQLLAEIRIPQHAIPSKWDIDETVNFFLIGLAAAWFGRKYLIGQLLLVILLFVAATILWAIIYPNPTLAVLAPWRVSTFLAPLSWVVLLATVSKWITQVINNKSSSLTGFGWAMIFIAASASSLIGIQDLYGNYQHKTSHKYYSISRFLEKYHESGNQYLVPVRQTYIRLEAGVPVFITWKSHPTKDNELIEWYKRIQIAKIIYNNRDYRAQSEMSDLIESDSVTHVIWPISKGDYPFSKMGKQVYRGKHYSLWDMRVNTRE